MGNPSPSRPEGRQYARRKYRGLQEDDSSKDESLDLFHNIKSSERKHKNFFSFSSNELEASLSTKLGGLTGMATPPWNTKDLLRTDIEKNDYNWLLTPPATPLFPTLGIDSPLPNQTHSTLKLSNLCQQHKGSGPNTPSSSSSSRSSNYFTTRRGPPQSPTRRRDAEAMARTATSRTSTTRRAQQINATKARSHSTGRYLPPSSNKTARGGSISPRRYAFQPADDSHLWAEIPPNLRTTISDRPSSRSRSATLRAGAISSEVVDRGEHHQQPRKNLSSLSRISSSTTSHDNGSSKWSVVSSSDDGTGMTGSDLDISSPRPLLRGKKTNIRGERTSADRATPASCSTVNCRFSSRKSAQPSARRMEHRPSQDAFRSTISSAPATRFHDVAHHGSLCKPSNLVTQLSMAGSSHGSSERGQMKFFPTSSKENSDEEESSESDSPTTRTMDMQHDESDQPQQEIPAESESRWSRTVSKNAPHQHRSIVSIASDEDIPEQVKRVLSDSISRTEATVGKIERDNYHTPPPGDNGGPIIDPDHQISKRTMENMDVGAEDTSNGIGKESKPDEMQHSSIPKQAPIYFNSENVSFLAQRTSPHKIPIKRGTLTSPGIDRRSNPKDLLVKEAEMLLYKAALETASAASKQLPNAEVSITGMSPKEANLSCELSHIQKDDIVHVSPTQRPTPIKGMSKSSTELDAKMLDSGDGKAKKEMMPSSICQCRIM